MRRIVTFSCEGFSLFGTVNPASGSTGVLVVSGGSEVRCGAHRGMALLAADLARAGVPVFRFDRRGVGDSDGQDKGFTAAEPDILAALAAFRFEQPQMTHVIGFGNCDAATSLLLHDHDCAALVVANPWLGDETAAPPPAVVRKNYLRKLIDPHAWRRLSMRGMSNVFGALPALFGDIPKQPLGGSVLAALDRCPVTIVLASGDRTGQIFDASLHLSPIVRVVRIATASHSFAGRNGDLVRILLDAVRDLHDKIDI